MTRVSKLEIATVLLMEELEPVPILSDPRKLTILCVVPLLALGTAILKIQIQYSNTTLLHLLSI